MGLHGGPVVIMHSVMAHLFGALEGPICLCALLLRRFVLVLVLELSLQMGLRSRVLDLHLRLGGGGVLALRLPEAADIGSAFRRGRSSAVSGGR